MARVVKPDVDANESGDWKCILRVEPSSDAPSAKEAIRIRFRPGRAEDVGDLRLGHSLTNSVKAPCGIGQMEAEQQKRDRRSKRQSRLPSASCGDLVFRPVYLLMGVGIGVGDGTGAGLGTADIGVTATPPPAWAFFQAITSWVRTSTAF